MALVEEVPDSADEQPLFRRPSTSPARALTPARPTGSRSVGTPKYVLEVVVNTPPQRLRDSVPRSALSDKPRLSTPVPVTPTKRQPPAPGDPHLKENLAQERSGQNSCLAHAIAVSGEHIWLEEFNDKGEEDFAKYSSPFLMITAG